VLISVLLAAPALGRLPLTSHCSRLDRPITWVSTTELPDPLPFLGGGELVMTTGMLERSEEDWTDLVRRLADLPVAALCFGVGLVHHAVPGPVVSAAEDSGLALVSSPVEVPFVQISRWVADRLFAEQYDAVQAMVTVQDQLVKELLSHNGLRGLLRRLHRELHCGAVTVLAADGRVIDGYPARDDHRSAHVADPRGAASVPIVVDDVPVATLCTQEPTTSPEVLAFAATILGLEVARQQAVLTGRRELLGQVLEDVLHRTASEADAKRRLATYGIAADAEHAMVVARVSGTADRLRRLPWTLGPLLERSGDRLPTALIDDSVVVVVPSGVDAGEAADVVAGHLALIDPGVRVGVGEPRRGVSGLRLGYFEARQAAQGGPGVHRAAPLSVTGLLLGNLDLPLQELGRGVLAPLLDHDARGGGELVTTLRAYLVNDCQPAATAAELVLHRNSLRYRLDLIERLTGRDLDRLTDRMELWLALAALDAG
jgi:purine catabolism regulator